MGNRLTSRRQKYPSPIKVTTPDEIGMGSHGERIGDGGRREPWAFCRFRKPTLPAKSAVGVATKSHIFIKDPLLFLL